MADIQQPAAEIAKFNDLTFPATINYDENTPSAMAARLLAQETISRFGLDYINFQMALYDNLAPQAEAIKAVRNGRFERIAHAAGRVATAAVGALQELNEDKKTVTISGLFAAHAIASCMVALNKPSIDEVPHSDDRSTYLLTCLASELAIRAPSALPPASEIFAFTDAIDERAVAMAAVTGNADSWMRRKLMVFAERLIQRKHTARIIDTEPPIEVDDPKELYRHNNALMQELNRLRCYSIKSAVHVEGDVSWSIHDFYDIKAKILPYETGGVRQTQWQPNMVMAAFEQYGDAVLVIPDIATQGRHFEIQENDGQTIFMDDKGELYFDVAGTAHLRTLYKQAGKINNYEALRQSMICKMFDLTVPEVIVEEVEAQTNRLLRRNVADKDNDTEPRTVVADLLLPRVRRLKSFKTIGALERYAQEIAHKVGEQSKIEEQNSRYKLHDVVAHPRKLPAGYLPSPEALALAKELNITLEDGETLVKPHDRGDAEKGVVVHKARKQR